ncbi:MAG: hypothetical protein KatS3mg129_0206 [Leptospiraceae bacterium]|nr:MAG: hypothetical protein KatS3mg129_0206 [Leptospiraceae bacterium]
MVIFRLLGYTEFSYSSTYLLILGFVFEKTLLSIIIGRYFYKSELNKKLLDNEFQIASKTQKFLLPANVPSNERIQFSWFYSPKLEVGGDFFDLYYKDNKYYILLMDVAGHGISGSMIASMVKIIFDKYKTIPEVSKILNLIRKSLIGKIGNLFITGIFLEIDLKNMSLSVHMAGHEPLYLIQKNKFQKIKLHGKPIAEYYDMDLEKSIISINKNDILFLYTDGLIELFNKQEELDIKKIINILEKNDFDIEKTNHEIQKIINKNKSKIDDDITYIFIKIK